ncbi:MAG: hypothetical protein Q8S84_02550 [bacterium]|nr:hypothetical protein [bacterium]MDP3380424.1 hypothetical protein [bacterium]
MLFTYSSIFFRFVSHHFTFDKIICFNTFVSSKGYLNCILSDISSSFANSGAFTIFQLNANAIPFFKCVNSKGCKYSCHISHHPLVEYLACQIIAIT